MAAHDMGFHRLNMHIMYRTTAICISFCLALLSTSAMAQTLVYCSEGSPEGFDPALYTSRTTFDATSRPIYNRLAEFKIGTTEVIPALAQNWAVADDGLSVTFTLRQGVRFHSNSHFTPSRDFNADDVVFTFDRQQDPENQYNQVSGGTWDYFNGMSMPQLIDSIEKIDDYTVRFNLTRPKASLLANLAMDFASIVSKEYADYFPKLRRRSHHSLSAQR